MNLRRRFSYRGNSRSFLSAGCPAPAGFPSAAFPLASTSFAFAGGPDPGLGAEPDLQGARLSGSCIFVRTR